MVRSAYDPFRSPACWAGRPRHDASNRQKRAHGKATKLEKLALIAELVSSIVVVVTLVFLLIGVRENSEMARASAYERNIDSSNEG